MRLELPANGPFWLTAFARSIERALRGGNRAPDFPATPILNERVFRTDRGIEYYWDGERWLSTHLYALDLNNSDALNPVSATTLGAWHAANPFANLYDLYLEEAVFTSYLTSAATWTLSIVTGNGIVSAAVASRSTAGDNATETIAARVTINDTIDSSAYVAFEASVTKSSGSANLYFDCALTFRLIG